MKPCDCRDIRDVEQLQEQGLRFNNESITIIPPNVILEIKPHVKVLFTQKMFTRFAAWYFQNQLEVTYRSVNCKED